MEIGEITAFINKLKSLIRKLDITCEDHGNFYYCTNKNKHCILIPHCSSLDYSVPTYKECLNLIIVTNDEKFLNRADLKCIHISTFDCIVNVASENQRVRELIDLFLFNSDLLGVFSNLRNNDVAKPLLPDSKIELIRKKDSIETAKGNDPVSVYKKYVGTSNSKEYNINIASVEHEIGCQLSNVSYGYMGDETYVYVAISKFYERSKRYWYGYHDVSKRLMDSSINGYVCLFFKDRPQFLLIPKSFFNKYFDKLNSSKKIGKERWHLYIYVKNGRYFWHVPHIGNIDVNEFIIDGESNTLVDKHDAKQEIKEDSPVVIKVTHKRFHS